MKPNRIADDAEQTRNETALFEAVLVLESVAECRNFFLDLCTPAELQALVDRWQVVRLLQEDLPYRRINELTGVSVTTIGRVARFVADGHGGYTTALGRIGSATTPGSTHTSH